MEGADSNFLGWALEDTDFISPRSFLERLGLEVAEVQEALLRNGFTDESWDKKMDKRQREALRSLARDPEFRDRVASVASSRKELWAAYLGEQGVLNGPDLGIVDLGWNGSLQYSLEKHLRAAGSPLPVGLYFGLNKWAAEMGLSRAFAYFFDDRLGQSGGIRNYWVEPMMEVFCSADHGLTLRFERREGRVQPVLKTPRNDRCLAWGLEHVQSAILQFVELMLANSTDAFDPEPLRLPMDALFNEFWNAPTRAEAEAWGTYPYSDDQTESFHMEWAAPLQAFDAIRSVYYGKLMPPHRAGWAMASLSLSSCFLRAALPLATRIGGRFRRRFL